MKKISGFILLLLLFAACQKPPVVEYSKYVNDIDVPRIPIEDAKRDYDAGMAIIVDSRPDAAYNQEHIKNAINIPIGSTDDKFATLPKGKKIIVYCS